MLVVAQRRSPCCLRRNGEALACLRRKRRKPLAVTAQMEKAAQFSADENWEKSPKGGLGLKTAAAGGSGTCLSVLSVSHSLLSRWFSRLSVSVSLSLLSLSLSLLCSVVVWLAELATAAWRCPDCVALLCRAAAARVCGLLACCGCLILLLTVARARVAVAATAAVLLAASCDPGSQCRGRNKPRLPMPGPQQPLLQLAAGLLAASCDPGSQCRGRNKPRLPMPGPQQPLLHCQTSKKYVS